LDDIINWGTNIKNVFLTEHSFLIIIFD
jgi:hypothetical protein